MTRRLCSAFLITLLLAACGGSSPSLSPLSPGATILAFGDSLTRGVGTEPSYSYPAVLSQLSGHPVVNAGVSGEVTAQGLQRLPDTLEEHRPELMVLLHGGNDILRDVNPGTTRDNLAAMIELAYQRGVQVVLLAVPEKSLFSSNAPFYNELAEDYGLAIDDSTVAWLLRRSEYKSDGVHFNADGYRRLAEAVHELLERHGALP